jgi:hypothetical protein
MLVAAGAERRLTIRAPLLSMLDANPCQFFAPDTRLCAIHRDLGAGFKPAPCRHFPRVALLDARGVSLTLSHVCPTAASTLFRDDARLAIVENPPAWRATDDYEGLDARGVLPPLLRPGLLWDLDGYSAWEEQAIDYLARAVRAPEGSLGRLRAVAERIQQWTPGDSSLREHVIRSFEALRHDRTPDVEAGSAWGSNGPVVNRYLAARLFASWVPYRADRLTALVDDLDRTLDVLNANAAGTTLLEAIRATDLRVVHGT